MAGLYSPGPSAVTCSLVTKLCPSSMKKRWTETDRASWASLTRHSPLLSSLLHFSADLKYRASFQHHHKKTPRGSRAFSSLGSRENMKDGPGNLTQHLHLLRGGRCTTLALKPYTGLVCYSSKHCPHSPKLAAFIPRPPASDSDGVS